MGRRQSVANPSPEDNHDKLTTRAAGFGVVRFNKPKRTITVECRPRNVAIGDHNAKQYPGWPITIEQQDNYGRKAFAYLPTLKVEGLDDPIVQVIDQRNGEIVYTLRIKGRQFRPKVFTTGLYTVVVGNQADKTRTLKDIESVASDSGAEISVRFD